MNTQGVNVSDFIKALGDAAAKLADTGPLGIVALMAVVATIIIMFVPFTPAIERFARLIFSLIALTLFGVLMIQNFAAKPAEAHVVRFRVEPTALATYSHFPEPIIEINSERLEKPYVYSMRQDVSAVIDVSAAFEKARKTEQEAMLQLNKIQQLQSGVVSSAKALQNIASTASSITCPDVLDGLTLNSPPRDKKILKVPNFDFKADDTLVFHDDFDLGASRLAARSFSSQIVSLQAETALNSLDSSGLIDLKQLEAGPKEAVAIDKR